MLSTQDFIDINKGKLDIYFKEVSDGKGISKLETESVARFFDIKSKYEYREAELIKVLKFFSLLHLSHKDKVQQIELLPVNIFWLASLLCFYEDENTRLVDQAYISIAKKNGKTTFFGAGLLLYFCLTQHLNSHIVVLASDTKQAKNSLDICKNCLINSPALKDVFQINRNLIYTKTETGLNQIEILSPRHSQSLQGRSVSFSLIDEFFAHKDSDGQQKLKSSTAARVNPLQVIITTAGNNQAISPASRLQDIAINILNGAVKNDKFFTQIFNLNDPEEIRMLDNPDEAYNILRKSNPAINHTVSQQFLLNEWQSTKTFPEKLTTFLTDHLNVWQNSNGTQKQFIHDDLIKPLMADDKRIPEGSAIYVGLDLSATSDLTSISYITYDVKSDTFISESIPILPSIDKIKVRPTGIDLSDDIGTFEQVIAGDKYLLQSQGEVLDEQLVIDILMYLNSKYKIISVGYDPWQSQILAYRLAQAGIPMDVLKQSIEVLGYPLRFFERYLKTGKFFMKKNRVVRIQFQAVVLYHDMNNNIKLNKTKSRDSIDCIASNLNAVAEWLKNNESAINYYYDVMKKQA